MSKIISEKREVINGCFYTRIVYNESVTTLLGSKAVWWNPDGTLVDYINSLELERLYQRDLNLKTLLSD